MNIAALLAPISPKLPISEHERNQLETLAEASAPASDPLSRFSRAIDLLEQGRSDEMHVIYLRLRELESESKIAYGLLYDCKQDWPILHHPNNLARSCFLVHDEALERLPEVRAHLMEILDVTYAALKQDYPGRVKILEYTGLARLVGPQNSNRYR